MLSLVWVIFGAIAVGVLWSWFERVPPPDLPVLPGGPGAHVQARDARKTTELVLKLVGSAVSLTLLRVLPRRAHRLSDSCSPSSCRGRCSGCCRSSRSSACSSSAARSPPDEGAPHPAPASNRRIGGFAGPPGQQLRKPAWVSARCAARAAPLGAAIGAGTGLAGGIPDRLPVDPAAESTAQQALARH